MTVEASPSVKTPGTKKAKPIHNSASFDVATASAKKSTPIKSSASFTSPPSSFGSTGGGSGFFSLGESNIAERAKRLKEERNMNKPKAEKNAADSNGAGKESAKDEIDAEVESEKELHEFDSLLISNQVNESDNVLHKALVKGFRSLRASRISQSPDGGEESVNGDLATDEEPRYSATVNFIDPTTKTTPGASSAPSTPVTLSSKPAKPTNLLQQQSMLSKRVASSSSTQSSASSTSVSSPGIENVYENLTYIFEKEYGSTIRSVQYKNARTGETNTIRSLPVRPVITRNGSRGTAADAIEQKSPSSANTPWGGTMSTAMLPASDPAEWHTGPFCHVYIAACEDVEHYRKKVRPSLRAFVSQLESTDSNTTANQQGGHSADYLIVYIPIGGESSKTKKEATTPSASKPSTNTGRLGFFGIGRQRFSGSAPSDGQGDSDDLSSKDSIDSGDEALDMNNHSGMDGYESSESGTINVLMTFNHLSKPERSLYKKIATNFPNGKVCVLSTSSLERVYNSEDGLAIRVQEWNVFNRLLGQVIVNGFQDRMRRYKNELKRLDAQRASAATAAKNYVSKGSVGDKVSKPNPYAFNLSHFFLVKESLAFSYEQMQLPAEALLQYDEFRLYMPDLSDKEESKVRRARRKSKALREDTPSENLAGLADAGDFLGFRKKIRTEYDLTAILDIMRRYLFARELSLLFRMEQPVEILSRCQAFVKVMYSILLRGISELDEQNQTERKTKAATWVVQFSWDIYCAAIQYLSCPITAQDSSEKRDAQPDEVVGSKLSEILEVSRLFLLQLADDHPESLQTFSMRRNKFPKDLQTSWPSWTPYEPSADDNKKSRSSKGIGHTANLLSEGNEREFLVASEEALASIDQFEEAYLKMCLALIDSRQIAKHHRLSARIQAEVGEYYASQGNFSMAVASFQKIVKVYRMDHWDRCHFWRVFRLAYCQRTSVEPTAYLKTLCSCFSPRSTAVAPKKALVALFDDLQKVIEHPSIGNARYSRLLFIETSLSISSDSDKSKMGKILDQKELQKKFCSVGESFQIPISIKSHLPGSIELTSVKLFAVTVDTFKDILANGDAVQEEDAAKVLSINAPIKLNPGKNDFAFEWSPPRPGQYILSTVEILWKEGYFYYDSMDLQEPLLSVDVVPSEPTHSISLEPVELVPGHDQEVEITFEAGSDTITSGKLYLLGSNGITLIPPGEDPGDSEWRQDWEVDLKPCKPGEKQVMTARVRCGFDQEASTQSISDDDSVNARHGFFAKAHTTYLVAKTEGADESSMKTSVESFAPVLEKTALSIESVEFFWLENNEKVLLNVLLTSNAPYGVVIDGWEIRTASPITILSDLDLNENLLKRRVCDGDQLSFSFECSVEKATPGELGSSKENKIHLKLCDDEGKKFSIDLPLDLRRFYSRLPSLVYPNPMGCVQAILKLEKDQGLVGEPLAMTIEVDTSGYESSNPVKDDDIIGLAYSIGCSEGDWLLGGKVNGIIDLSCSMTLTCVGIPIVPGTIEHFPTISFEVMNSSGTGIPINVEYQQPESYQSMPMNEINAIATPRFERR